jgi:transcriptional regulator with XRE-family HTH domain
MSQRRNASDRVLARLSTWAEHEGRGSRKKLAEAVTGKYGEPMTIQWASGVINGHQKVSLDQLDAIAALLGVPPGDLVKRDEDHYMEVLPHEMRFVGHLRSMPDAIRRHLMYVWDYFLETQDRILVQQKDQVDRRTKAARLQRDRLRDDIATAHNNKAR